jgi:hypothetical protein
MAFWLCSLYLKYILNIFENVKKQTKILRVHLHILRVHEMVLRKKMTFYMTYVNITKFGTPSDPYYSLLILMYLLLKCV